MTFGIDISTYQNRIDLEDAIREGVKFAIIRGSFTGTSGGYAKDDRFEQHYKNCKNLGIDVGVYHYSLATNYEEGKKEAEFLYKNCLKDKVFEYPIYIDIESNIKGANYNEAARGFCDYIESVGGYAAIYCNLNTANNLLNYNELSKDFDFWLAYWGNEMPSRNKYGNYGMWQFGGDTNNIRSNKIGGLICDQDYAYKDYPEIMINQNLNNFTKKDEIDTPNDNENIPEEEIPNDEPEEEIDDNNEETDTNNFFDKIVSFFKRIIDYITSLFKN